MTAIVRIQIRRDTAANWTSTNPTLASGERGLETDTRREKIGDGTTAWNSLPYSDSFVYTPIAPVTAGIGSPRQVYTYESRTLFHNNGATALVYLNLDNASAAIGAEYEFACLDADGIRFKATASDYIQDGSNQSVAGGYMRSVVIGSVIRIKAIKSGVWIVVAKTGTWTIDS